MKLLINYFIISAFITMLILYLTSPNPRVIIRHPDPRKEVSDMYVDENRVCYKYHRELFTE